MRGKSWAASAGAGTALITVFRPYVAGTLCSAARNPRLPEVCWQESITTLGHRDQQHGVAFGPSMDLAVAGVAKGYLGDRHRDRFGTERAFPDQA